MLRLWSALLGALRGERGSSSVEYGVIVFLVGAMVITAVALLGASTSESFDCVGRAWASVQEC